MATGPRTGKTTRRAGSVAPGRWRALRGRGPASGPEDARQAWSREFRASLRMAIPLALAQLGQVALGVTDTLMLGRLGEAALAAGGLGSGTFFSVFIVGVGLAAAAGALAAQEHGARHRRGVRRVVRQGFQAIGLFSLPCLLLLAFAEPLLLRLGQPAGAAADAGAYVLAAMWSLPTGLGFIVLRGFMAALDRPVPAMWIMWGGVALNVPLDYLLIFGGMGLPALGVAGAGVATSLVNVAMFTALLWIAIRRPPFRRYALLARFGRADWPVFRRIWRVGLPIGITLSLEVGLFYIGMLLVGRFGTTALAAHQIAIQTAALTFMVPLGIGHAVTARVGQAFGRHDPAGIGRAGWTGLGMATIYMAGTALLFWFMPGPIVSAYLDTTDPANRETTELATTLLRIAALFQLADGAQVVGLSMLRGLNDTKMPMYVAGFGFVAVGIGGSALFGLGLDMGPVGIWIGLALGLGVVGVLTVIRFWRRRHWLRDWPSPAGSTA